MRALRQYRLPLPPRAAPEQRIAFSADRIAVLGHSEAIIRDRADFRVVLRVPIQEPRRVVTLRDDSLLVVGQQVSLRIPAQSKGVEQLVRISMFPGSLLIPDRLTSERIWTLPKFSSELYGYRFRANSDFGVGLQQTVPLEAFDHRGFLGLRDGSFLFTAGERWVQFWMDGKPLISQPSALTHDLWRMLWARRLDQFWVARPEGRLDLVQIGPNYISQGSIDIGKDIFDLASIDRWIVFLRVEQPKDGPRRWSLGVTDALGKVLLNADLPPDPPAMAGEGWVEELLRNRQLAVSELPPSVAVGGPDSLKIWDLTRLTQVFSEPP